jgi:hypothetical protein
MRDISSLEYGKWNQYDFLTCLEVMPEEEDFGVEYVYRVNRAGMKLTVQVIPWADTIRIGLAQEDAETFLMQFALLVRGKILHEWNRSEEWLEFHDCVVLPCNSWFHYGTAPEILENQPGFRVQLSIKPFVKVCLEVPPP